MFCEHVVEEELSGFFVVGLSKGTVDWDDFSSEILSAQFFNVSFKLFRASKVSLPVWFRSNSTLSAFGFSFLPEIFTSDVLLARADICNAVDETEEIANIVSSERFTFI